MLVVVVVVDDDVDDDADDSLPDATVNLPIGVSEVLPWRSRMMGVVDVMTLWSNTLLLSLSLCEQVLQLLFVVPRYCTIIKIVTALS